MVKDYRTIWIKWIALLHTDAKLRTEILRSLHIEVTNGLDVITRIAVEELENKVSEKDLFILTKDAIESSLAFSVWGGYMLFLIANNIDPEKENLIARGETNNLGNEWTKNYDKDQTKSLLAQIDPLLTLILEKETQERINTLFAAYPQLVEIRYKEIGYIDTFENWAAYQGFILGFLEQELFSKKEKTKA